MGSAERIRISAGLAAHEGKTRPVAIVVSAMSKITDLLLATMRHAEAGDQAGMDANLAALRARHEEACCTLLPEDRQPNVLAEIDKLIVEFERIVRGMALLGERPPRSVDGAPSREGTSAPEPFDHSGTSPPSRPYSSQSFRGPDAHQRDREGRADELR